MEAYKILWLKTDSNGNKTAITNKSFAATGWEATEKSRKYLHRIGHTQLTFLKWKVLNPGQAHFK